MYNIRGTFLDYETVVRKLPRAWRDKIHDNTDICKNLNYNVQINPYIKFILKDKKGCRSIYDKRETFNLKSIIEYWLQILFY